MTSERPNPTRKGDGQTEAEAISRPTRARTRVLVRGGACALG